MPYKWTINANLCHISVMQRLWNLFAAVALRESGAVRRRRHATNYDSLKMIMTDNCRACHYRPIQCALCTVHVRCMMSRTGVLLVLYLRLC